MINVGAYRTRAIALVAFSHLFVVTASLMTYYALTRANFGLSLEVALIIAGATGYLCSLILSHVIVKVLAGPLKMIVQALLYLSDTNITPPTPGSAPIAKDFTQSLLRELYSVASSKDIDEDQSLGFQRKIIDSVLSGLPMPLVILGHDQSLQYLNPHAKELLYKKDADPISMPLMDAIKLDFKPGVKSISSWLSGVKEEKIQSYEIWRNVAVATEADRRFYDLVVFYNANETHGLETIVAFVDRTNEYSDQDDQLSFIALAVHELRTPITLIRGYVEVLEKELSGKVDKEYADFIHKLHLAAERLAVFTNNVLNVARVESKQINLKLTSIPAAKLVKDSVEERLLWAKIEKRLISIKAEDSLPSISVDVLAIQEVIGNLLDNAIKYSNTGSTIVVSAETQANQLVISVADEGVGIPANVLTNIFSRFYRSHHTKGTVSGSGLGLYLAKAIVEAHKGNIEIRSSEGEGTTVTIKLPLDLATTKPKRDNSSQRVGWIKNHNLQRR